MLAGRFRRLMRAAGAIAFALVLAALEFAGVFEEADRIQLEWRYRLLSRSPSPSVVVVDIDARSLAEIGAWPFPRARYARVIDRLVEAGARAIAIDIDFGLASAATDDAALAEAIARARGRVILPSFVQASAASGAPIENAPLPALAAHAQLAAVNLAPERDGRVWRYPVAVQMPGGFMPAMAVRLAGSALYGQPSFLIDYAIAPDSLVRFSFVDVLEGRVDPDRFAARPVIIGATALELGDLRAVPVAGNLPSVLIKALAHESIVQRRMVQATSPAVVAIGLLVLAAVLASRRGRGSAAWSGDALLAGGVAILATGTAIAVQAAAPLAVGTTAWLVLAGGWLMARIVLRVERLAAIVSRRRRAALRARRLVEAVVAESFDGVIAVDGRGEIVFANPAAAALLGVERRALVGKPLAIAWPTAATIGGSDGRGRAEIAMTRPGGGERFLDVATNRAGWIAGEGAAAAPAGLQLFNFRDVTEQRRARVALGLAQERAEQASRLKSQFLATMSHELRTPLNAIMGFSELIRDGRFGGDIARYREYAGDIHASGEHLLQVINDILDLSRIEVGQVEIRRELVDLGEVVLGCAGMVRELAGRQQIGLTVTPPSPGAGLVVADVVRMRQIVLNLLSNAIKFTAAPGAVVASVRPYDGDRVAIEVEDTGIGMSAEEIAIALQPFRQVDSRLERRFTGAGLGLPIAKALAELQGGSMEIDSEPGRGTRVRVVIRSAPIGRAVA